MCAHAHMLPAIYTDKPQRNAVRIRPLHWVGDLYLLWVLYSTMYHARNSRCKPCFPTCGASYTMLHSNTTHDEIKHLPQCVQHDLYDKICILEFISPKYKPNNKHPAAHVCFLGQLARQRGAETYQRLCLDLSRLACRVQPGIEEQRTATC